MRGSAPILMRLERSRWCNLGRLAGEKTERFLPGEKLRFPPVSYTHLYLKAGEQVRGHEFHYWDSDCCGELMEAKKPESSRSWPCMIAKKRVMAGFPHLYYPSCPQIPRRFIEQCRIYHQEKEKKDGSSHDGRKGDFTG